MTSPVVWLPEADAELKAALAWYDDVRSELGERFARAIDATVRAIAQNPLQFSSSIEDFGALVSADFPMVYSLRSKRAGFW